MILRPIRKWALSMLLVGYAGVAWLINAMPGQHDFTEDRRFSLPDSLLADLGSLPRRVTIRLFATSSHPDFGFDFVRYRERLLEVLRQLSGASGGKLSFEVLDPNRDARASRLAAVDEVRMIANGNDDLFCFGLTVECLDKKRCFGFLDPRRGQYFFNDLISAIFHVGQDRLPRIGIVTPFPGWQKGGSVSISDWTGIERLRQGYDLSFPDSESDWNDLNLAIMFQPSEHDASQDAKFEALLARGCDVLVLADPLSVGVESMRDRRMAEYRSSRMPRFVERRGVSMKSGMVICDSMLQTQVAIPGGRRANPAILTLGASALNAEHPITAGVDRVQFYLAGALELSPPKQYEVTILASSSAQATLVDADVRLLADPGMGERILSNMRRMKTSFPLLVLLKNTVNPKEGRILVGSDIDWLHREVAGTQRDDGSLQAQNANAALMQNLIDYLAGNQALRETRTRGLARHPLAHWSEIRNSLMEPCREAIGAIAKDIETLEAQMSGIEAARNISAFDMSENEHANRRLGRLREEVRLRRAELARLRHEQSARVKAIINLIYWSNAVLPPTLLLGLGWIAISLRERRTRGGAMP